MFSLQINGTLPKFIVLRYVIPYHSTRSYVSQCFSPRIVISILKIAAENLFEKSLNF
jgi:hypothetical protein